jgi:GT2 family glycosyltransferase
MFLRREMVVRVGDFDEALGLGSGTPWSSGEEIDYLVRALLAGARIEYDPSLQITHPVKPVSRDELVALGRRDGGSVGYVLARNRYPARAVARMLVRPGLGALASLALLDTTRARFHAATLGGRLAGLRAGRRAR